MPGLGEGLHLDSGLGGFEFCGRRSDVMRFGQVRLEGCSTNAGCEDADEDTPPGFEPDA